MADDLLDILSGRILIAMIDRAKRTVPQIRQCVRNDIHECTNTDHPTEAVRYRVRKLVQLGYMTELAKSINHGAHWDSPRFLITDDGVAHLEQNRDEYESRTTLEAVANQAQRARQEASSANESVQGYRTKLHRIDERQKWLAALFEELTGVTVSLSAQSTDGQLQRLPGGEIATMGWVSRRIRKQTKEMVDASKMTEAIGASHSKLAERNSQLQERIDELENSIEQTQSRVNELETELRSMQEEDTMWWFFG